MEISLELIRNARKLFKNYPRMQMEIKQLAESIECAKKNKETSVNSDIYSASVSHGSGSMGSGANSSADKIPRIAENIDKIRKQYDKDISDMVWRKTILERAVNSINIYISSLEWIDKTMFTRHYVDEQRKSYDEISAEVLTTAEALRKRERKLIEQYVRTAHIDINAVVNLL